MVCILWEYMKPSEWIKQRAKEKAGNNAYARHDAKAAAIMEYLDKIMEFMPCAGCGDMGSVPCKCKVEKVKITPVDE